jgi:hypothetical protein
MTLEVIRAALGWCTLINWGILLFWWAFISLSHDWVYGVHSKWFKISVERFDEVHYQAMALFKIGIMIFNLTPYIALRIVG